MASAYLKYRKTNNASRERLNQLKKAMLTVANHNLEAAAGKHTWTMAVNHFADLSLSELSVIAGPYSEINNITQTAALYKPKPGASAPPASIDYRKEGIVTSVKDQGGYGTCTMMAATAILESADARANSRAPIDLGTQELADCYDTGFTCVRKGSDTETALIYMRDYGLATAKAYPYTAGEKIVGPCKRDFTPRAAQAKSYTLTRGKHTDESLMQLLAESGPLMVAIQSTNGFGGQWFYKKGVFTGDDCKKDKGTNHTVTLVGYGEEGGLKYWLIKNRYGTDWGEDGYGKLMFGVCGIPSTVSFVVAKKL